MLNSLANVLNKCHNIERPNLILNRVRQHHRRATAPHFGANTGERAELLVEPRQVAGRIYRLSVEAGNDVAGLDAKFVEQGAGGRIHRFRGCSHQSNARRAFYGSIRTGPGQTKACCNAITL